MKLCSRILIVVLFFVSTSELLAQGCSDAGFCTMGAMRPAQVYNKKLNFKLRALAIDYYYGNTTLSPEINAVTADFTFGLSAKSSFQVKLPYVWVSGNLGETTGLGDISLSFTRNMYSSENFHINATLGAKIPTGKSDQEFSSENGSGDLPMYYQTSLGSYDAIAGMSMISRKWMFATGIQIALTENENDFRWGEWSGYPSQSYLLDHALANNLKRGVDVMFRVERTFLYSKFDFRLGLLPIFRVTKDEILDIIPGSPTNGERIKVEGTTGLAMSGIAGAAYHFNTKNSLKLTYGVKIDQRDVNPDQLTRDWITSVAYVIRF
ncbi:MAG: transporter [bacterium]|nr:transporter [bacterium]